jgi:hypothetical protein
LTLRTPLLLVLVGLILSGMAVGAVARIRYHRLNIAAQPTALSLKVAGAEMIVGLATMLLVAGGAAAAPAVWAVYVLRPVALERLTQAAPAGIAD